MELDFCYENNSFFIKDDSGKKIAEVTFPEKAFKVIDLNHTFVDDSLRGQGVAGKLVKKVAEFAAENEMKIVPTCSYAASWFEKHEEYKNLVYTE